MRFTKTQVMVQHLVAGITSTSPAMPTVTLIHTQTLATITLFQVEYKTRQQSWLGPTNLHLMRWRCFILAEAVSSNDQFFQKCLSEVPLYFFFSFASCSSHQLISVNFSTILWLFLSHLN